MRDKRQSGRFSLVVPLTVSPDTPTGYGFTRNHPSHHFSHISLIGRRIHRALRQVSFALAVNFTVAPLDFLMMLGALAYQCRPAVRASVFGALLSPAVGDQPATLGADTESSGAHAAASCSSETAIGASFASTSACSLTLAAF